MSEKLLESDFLTVDLRTIYNRTASTTPAAENDDSPKPDKATTDDTVKNLLEKHISDPVIIEKILAFGEPFRKAIKVLGEKTALANGGNPILAFIIQPYVQKELILPGRLNINTFKAIYNAVAKKLVADSEFFKVNNYNIIYCRGLYKKPAAEIETYLKLQNKILKVDVSEYAVSLQEFNRKVFLETAKPDSIPTVQSATKLNSLKQAKQLVYNTAEDSEEDNEETALHYSAAELDKIVTKLDNHASKFAAILALSTSTKSKKARKALGDPRFTVMNLSQKQIANAFIAISNSNILPKGQLKEDDADLLVLKILDTLDSTEVHKR